MEKIIFLDVDGVLNPNTNIWHRKRNGEPTDSYRIVLPGDKLYRLKTIVNQTNAKIVVSSSWRIGFRKSIMEPSPAIQNLQYQLNNYGLSIYDCTRLDRNRNRGIEITWWLNSFIKQNGYRPRYIIIDDDIADLIPVHRGHIVQTTTLLGLQDKHVNIAINLLNN